jgi:hypothetical protein
MTLAALICFLVILFAAGLPLVLFIRPDTDGRRVLLAPVLGLCGIVLFTCFLASLGLTGRVIGKIALVALVVVAATAVVLPRRWTNLAAKLKVEPFAMREIRPAMPALAAGLFGCALICWPLIQAGCTNYWGLANPDQAFYMVITDHLEHHEFGLPPPDRFHSKDKSVRSAILGLAYLFPMVSLLTGIPSIYLFGVLCAAMVFLLATSAYLLCRTGLGVSFGAAAVVAFMVALSSVGAQTFYHSSLGALAVAAVCPAGLALAALYTRHPGFRNAMLLALLLAGMMFCYFPAFAVLALLVGGWLAIPLLRRKLQLRSLILVGGLAVVLAAVVFAKQSVALSETLVKETFSNRLADSDDETILTIDSILTEDFIPSVWGLKTLGLGPFSFLGPPFQATIILVGLGALFSAVMLIGYWKNAFPLVFKSALVVSGGIIFLYFYRNNGYGVYKLITWLAPLATIAFGVSCVALSGSSGRLKWLARTALVAYAALNLLQTVRLTKESRRTGYGGINDAPGVTLTQLSELSAGGGKARPQALFAAIPDQVLQRWASVFLTAPNVEFLPLIPLVAYDSDSRLAVEYRKYALGKLSPGYLLSTTSARQDIVPTPPPDSFIWHGYEFAISPLSDVRNLLLIGQGWYRREIGGFSGPPQSFRWMRKRAELFILNPAPGPQRLCLRVMDGYGNSSPVRHLDLFLNGQKFDEVTIAGEGRFLSRPFSASGPASQLEIMVEEDVGMLPRPHVWWNRWVPNDPRHLNLAVFEASLQTAAASSGSLQPSLDFASQSPWTHALYNGLFPDRWLAGKATVEMRVPSDAGFLRLRGLAPGGTSLVFPLHLRVYDDDRPLGDAIVNLPGNFDISLPLPRVFPRDAQEVRIGIEPESRCFVGKSDSRCLTVRLDQVSFEASASRDFKSSAAKSNSAEGGVSARLLQNSPGH